MRGQIAHTQRPIPIKNNYKEVSLFEGFLVFNTSE